MDFENKQQQRDKYEEWLKKQVDENDKDKNKVSYIDLAHEDAIIENKIRDEAKIAEVRASLGLEQATDHSRIKKHLREYLGIEQKDADRIELLTAENLPEHYQAQREALHDKRLDGVIVAVIPDDLWVKGNQPTESSAEKQLISIKQSYFEAQENPDEIAWLCHELAHCQNFLDSESPEQYQSNMQKFAFEDLKTEYTYPNNPVEQFTFTKQLQYLKEQGKSRKEVITMLGEYYNEEDFSFFNRLLDDVYN